MGAFNRIQLIVILTFLLFVTAVKTDCVSSRETSYTFHPISIFYYNAIKCNNISVDQFNPMMKYFQHVHRRQILIINNSKIPNIYEDFFKEFIFFRIVDFFNDSISTIHPLAFSSVPNLTTLHLGYNNITNIEKYTFDNCKQLKVLNMTDNKLTSVENLQNITSLEELYLSNNMLTSLNGLHMLTSLKVLHLSNNKNITLSQLDIFSSLSNLTDVAISNLSLETIPSTLYNIAILDVSHNKLSEISGQNISLSINLSYNIFEQIPEFSNTVTEINLGSNNLTQIFSYSFKKLTNLLLLNLSDCKIAEISVDAFNDLINLRQLHLRANNLKKIETGTFYHLENLEILDLSSNDIIVLEHGIFSGLNKLSILNLNSNNIRLFNINVLHPLKSLKEFYIQGNRLYKFIGQSQLTNHLVNLKKISISFSFISCSKLSEYMNDFKEKNIFVVKGPEETSSNINGIDCELYNMPEDYEEDGMELYYVLDTMKKVKAILIVITVVFFISVVFTIIKIYRKFSKKRSEFRHK